jgi:hypothetical protein
MRKDTGLRQASAAQTAVATRLGMRLVSGPIVTTDRAAFHFRDKCTIDRVNVSVPRQYKRLHGKYQRLEPQNKCMHDRDRVDCVQERPFHGA